ncbi:MAG: hypothetical protein JXA60_05770 [Candidatus Coatesbacteria bacterium]|nr:hypothetical protein [Candidatus Coatesbacteria bacterium]
MKYLWIILLVPALAYALTIIDGNTSYQYNNDELKAAGDTLIVHEIYKAKTKQRVKYNLKGQWLNRIFDKLGHPKSRNFSYIFIGSDGYKSEVTNEQINNMKFFLAWEIDGKKIENDGLHLYCIGLSNMYSVKDLASIDLNQNPSDEIKSIFIFDTVLNALKISSEEVPSEKGKINPYWTGIHFTDIIKALSTMTDFKDRITVYGMDGLKRNFSYEKYLKDTILHKEEDGSWLLKGRKLLSGMWVKKVIAFSVEDKCFIIAESLKEQKLSSIWELLKLKDNVMIKNKSYSREASSRYKIGKSEKGYEILE